MEASFNKEELDGFSQFDDKAPKFLRIQHLQTWTFQMEVAPDSYLHKMREELIAQKVFCLNIPLKQKISKRCIRWGEHCSNDSIFMLSKHTSTLMQHRRDKVITQQLKKQHLL